MKLQGTLDIQAARDRAYAFLLDPRELAECIDDPHTLEVQDADHFRGTLKSGVGPVRGTFAFTAAIAERVAGERARIKVHGTGMGSAFDIDASIVLSDGSGSTKASWEADVTLGGTIASLGARLMQTTIDKKTSAFFENVRQRLEAA